MMGLMSFLLEFHSEFVLYLDIAQTAASIHALLVRLVTNDHNIQP